MPVTLTDEQVSELRARLGQAETNRQIAEAASKLWNSPERGDRAKQLWKEEFPDTDLGAYDVEQRINKRLDAEKKEREDERKAAADRDLDQRIAEGRKMLKEDRGFTDDAVERLEKFMVEREIRDYDDAADLFITRNPRPSDGQDGGYDSQYWQHEKQDLFKQIAADPEEWGRGEILKTLRSQEQQQRRY